MTKLDYTKIQNFFISVNVTYKILGLPSQAENKWENYFINILHDIFLLKCTLMFTYIYLLLISIYLSINMNT